MIEPLRGIIGAAPTPIQPDGTVDFERIPKLVEFMLQLGVDGFYVLGSTGEGISLTSAERQLTAEAFIAAVGKRRPVIVQVGQNSLAQARALAAHAAAAGADAISSTPPSYFRPMTVPILTKCMQEIAAGAEGLPFYYYHIPSVTGVTVDMPEFLEYAGDVIPNLAGLKFTSFAVWEYQACLQVQGGRFDCLYGHDEMLLPALAVGARGAVGSTYSFAAPLYRRILNAFHDGDLETARAEQARAVAMIRVLCRRGGLPAIKAAMALAGMDCGPVRPPLVALTELELDELDQELRPLDVFEKSLQKVAM